VALFLAIEWLSKIFISRVFNKILLFFVRIHFSHDNYLCYVMCYGLESRRVGVYVLRSMFYGRSGTGRGVGIYVLVLCFTLGAER